MRPAHSLAAQVTASLRHCAACLTAIVSSYLVVWPVPVIHSSCWTGWRLVVWESGTQRPVLRSLAARVYAAMAMIRAAMPPEPLEARFDKLTHINSVPFGSLLRSTPEDRSIRRATAPRHEDGGWSEFFTSGPPCG